jgi:hypothetical protein
MTPSELIARARTACNKGVVYGLGEGGYHPDDPLPARQGMHLIKGDLLPSSGLWCDCSGFVAWLCRRSRKPDNDFRLWLSTDSIVHDALMDHILFTAIQTPVAGCFAVYPDYKAPDGSHHQGHVALITDPEQHLVIDCCASKNGIFEHVQDVFWHTVHPVTFCTLRDTP